MKKLYNGSVFRGTCNPEGDNNISVTNWDNNSVITLDTTGRDISTLQDDEITYTTVQTVLDNGSV